MNRILIHSIAALLFILIGCKSLAQEFKTHAVKQGETLYSIAKQYKVTPYNILKYNKEIKQDDVLRPNTILVIPVDAKASDTSAAEDQTDDQASTEAQEQPIGFDSHKVRKRETLYGIAQRYHITEEDIKRYNRELYSSQLKKRMVLRIPKYREKMEGDTINPEDFETYKVMPKETRWSIAHKYGITLDSMMVLNPALQKNSDYLAVGQELTLPKIAGSSVDAQDVLLFESYTVPAKMNFFRMEQKFGIKSNELIKLNPEIAERGGLKEGMVLRIPKRKADLGEVNTDNYIFYEVKPKQTEYSLTRNLGITYKELIDLNPDLANGLKAGMVLKLPREKAGSLEVKNSLILDKINLLDSVNTGNRPKLLILFPFRTDRVDFNDKENAKKTIEARNDIKYSLGLYSGALVALDSIAKLGVSVDLKTYDTQLSVDKAKEILRKENLNGFNAIIGPLDPKSLKEVAVQAAGYQIPVIAPLASQSDISLNNVFFSIPTDEVLRKRMLDYVEDKRTGENMIIIADERNKDVKEKILLRFPLAKIVEIKEEEKNISMNIAQFSELLSEETENWVFVETDNFKLVSSVSSILNSVNTEDIKVRMFTTNKNRAFDNDVISGSHLSNLNFTYPSAYREIGNNAFVRQYRKRFGSDPDRYAIRGFDLTYDLLLKLAYKINLFEGSNQIGLTEYTGNKFNYNKDVASGYYNQASYIIMYEDMQIKEVSP